MGKYSIENLSLWRVCDGLRAGVWTGDRIKGSFSIIPAMTDSEQLKGLKVAIVHDWLYINGGAEKVLEQMILCFPGAHIFSLFDFLPPQDRGFLGGCPVTTSFLQKLPFTRRFHRMLLPLMPFAIEQFNFAGYDLVISSSYSVAKGIIPCPGQPHICYCHSPLRYAWDMQNEYLSHLKMGCCFINWTAKLLLHRIRQWDVNSSFRVGLFIANSVFVGKRIQSYYGRSSVVIHPPVDVESFTFEPSKEDYYVTSSRMVPYKRIDLIVKAFAKMTDKKLVVIGDGPEFEKIKTYATSNIEFKGFLPRKEMVLLIQKAKAYVFAALEDFGIAPVEAQACGTPVIAYGRGGVCESLVATGPNATAVFFNEQKEDALVEAVQRFERISPTLLPENCRKNAERFSNSEFKRKLKAAAMVKMENDGKLECAPV